MSLQDDLDRVTPLSGMAWVISALKAVRIFNDGKADHQEWIDAAIRLLESAGKVSEAREEYAKFGIPKWHEYMNAIQALTNAALLSALPEPGRKGADHD